MVKIPKCRSIVQRLGLKGRKEMKKEEGHHDKGATGTSKGNKTLVTADTMKTTREVRRPYCPLKLRRDDVRRENVLRIERSQAIRTRPETAQKKNTQKPYQIQQKKYTNHKKKKKDTQQTKKKNKKKKKQKKKKQKKETAPVPRAGRKVNSSRQTLSQE